jgi:hypothetical protein
MNRLRHNGGDTIRGDDALLPARCGRRCFARRQLAERQEAVLFGGGSRKKKMTHGKSSTEREGETATARMTLTASVAARGGGMNLARFGLTLPENIEKDPDRITDKPSYGNHRFGIESSDSKMNMSDEVRNRMESRVWIHTRKVFHSEQRQQSRASGTTCVPPVITFSLSVSLAVPSGPAAGRD